MMTAMSNDYESIIVKFRGDLNDTMLVKLRKEVVLQYKSQIKTGGSKTTSESVLTASTSKTPWKKFKGTCRNCGKIGHKAHKCQSNKVESTDQATKNSGTSGGNNKAHVTCYNSQQKGHFANKCPNPKKAKSDATDDMNMCVRVTFTDGPTDSKPTNIEPEADTMEEYVGLASKVGHSEEWLLDSGATCGVIYDNSHMTDMKPLDREITIGNGDKVATQGQGMVLLTDKLGQTIKLTDVYLVISSTFINGEIPKTLNNFAVFNNTNDFTIYRNLFYNIALKSFILLFHHLLRPLFYDNIN